jgi:hypothetical protein
MAHIRTYDADEDIFDLLNCHDRYVAIFGTFMQNKLGI